MQETTTITEIAVQSDPSEQSDQSNPVASWLPWAIWLIATGFVLYQFQLQMCSGPMVKSLMQDFSITALGAGILSSTYYYVYALMQMPAGMLIDRFGARRLLSISSAVCMIGCLLFATTSYLLVAELGRVLMGAGSAFAFVGALYLIGQWFPPSRFAMLLGMSDMIGSIGSLLSNIALAASVAAFSWRSSMLVAAAIAGLLTILNVLVIRDRPPGKSVSREPIDFSAFLQQVKALFQHRELWIHGLYVGIMFAVVTVFCGMWGIPLISLQAHISNTMATTMMSITFAGLGVSCPIMGWLFPRVRRPRWMLAGCSLIAALIITIVVYFPPHHLVDYGALMFLMGMVMSAYVFNFGLIQEITQPEVRTTANGFVNMLCVGLIPLYQPLIGFLLHKTSSHQIVAGQEVYTIANYQLALSVIPITLLIAAVLALMLPKHERQIAA